jgi:GH15 family glucan-1,4-alpha-glucosidase
LVVDGTVRARAALSIAAEYGHAGSVPWRRQGEYWTCAYPGVHAWWRGAGNARPDQEQAGLVADFDLAAGEHHDLVLHLSVRDDPMGADDLNPDELWRSTEMAWSRAIPPCRDLEAAADLRRAFAVLRGLTTPGGATVAAATTSLPERAQAGRNYDYRYAWVRDTCYIGRAGASVPGAQAVLDDAVRWLTERVLSDGAGTKPAYQVDGSAVPEPCHLGLPGYPGGSDVVGNPVGSQFQLDLFGEVLLILARAAGLDRIDADGWKAAEIAIDAIAQRYAEKESGIWEIEPNLWTHSRLICVAGLRAIAQHGAPGRWRTEALTLADRLLSQADRRCLHPSGRWQRAPDDRRVDASLLLAEVRGALPPHDPRSVATREAVLNDLSQDFYLYRYSDPAKPLGESEGAFLVCNFWMVLAKLRAGEVTSAARWFERSRASSGSSGLFSEEYDVEQNQLRGNIPQAFVHALLIESAAELSRA